jgi:hypothetical protein
MIGEAKEMKVFERNNQFLSMILGISLQKRKRRHTLPVHLIFREMHGRFTIPEVLQAFMGIHYD